MRYLYFILGQQPIPHLGRIILPIRERPLHCPALFHGHGQRPLQGGRLPGVRVHIREGATGKQATESYLSLPRIVIQFHVVLTVSYD